MSAVNEVKSSGRPLLTAGERAHPSVQRLIRGLQVASSLTAIVAVVIVIYYAVAALQWRSLPFPGFLNAYTMVVDGNTPFGGRDWPGLEAGIQRLDSIVAVNDVSLPSEDYAAARQTFRETLRGLSVGDEISVTVLRGTETATFSFDLIVFPNSDFLAFFVFPYISGLIALLVGLSLIFLRPKQPNALLVSLICLFMAIFMTGTFHNSTTHTFMPVWLIAVVMIACTTLYAVIVFPTRAPITYRAPFLFAIPALVSAIVLVINLSLYWNPPSPQAFIPVWQIPVGYSMVTFTLMLANLGIRRARVRSMVERDQINTGLIGIGLAAVPIFLWLVSTVAIVIDSGMILPFNSATAMPFFITVPISLAYAVLQYRNFNTDQILSQGITYLIMLGALVIGYFLLVFGINVMVNEVVPANNPFVVGTVIFFIAIAFLPFRTRLQSRIDSIYFRQRKEFQTLAETFARQLSSMGSFHDILVGYRNNTEDALSPRGIFIFLPDENNETFVANSISRPHTDIHFDNRSDFVRLLQLIEEPIYLSRSQAWPAALIPERSRLKILKARVIVGLRGSKQLNGFVVIGPPRTDKYDYSFEELRFLGNISTQMSVSVERAQVVESLERRVRELGVLSQVSQAVNFAVEFDDLLELISSQTTKVIDSTHFYIALRVQSSNQMAFAFFLEDDERFRDREGIRWQIGNDLFSNVLNQGTSQKVDDYVVAAAQQNLERLQVSDRVKAWMGVPLIAGQNQLGVMAAGNTRNGFSYSEGMLKIFSDIGSIAATSIDKARLFEVTNLRARQLSALNDISRQLQSERNVDVLTNLVTSSAVEILNAEAGSLLLTVTDDDSGDMEFRVVVGGSGADIIGTRVPAGHGLVGEVADNGKPVIVNDTQNDPRWQGEVDDSGFHTNAVLAVPLIVDNNVIGVLEVLNKKDGSTYVQEDADLLETFAAQAAVAIENARLFQMTDEQLTARVAELETLERIDTELNRTLELDRIAEITVKWAIANTGATTGLLGFVQGNPPMLHVMAKYGYADDEHPEGAVGDAWPLDRGIANRVLRTRQPDIQTDMSIDPDYVPSLKGATSQITVPMLSGKDITSMLILEKISEPKLNILDLAFVQRLAEHAAISIENARLYNELAQANESKGEFVRFVAHELKNPLQSIKGYSDILKNAVSGKMAIPGEQQLDFVSVIGRNADRMQTIINDLRDFEAMNQGQLRINPEPTSFANIVLETLRPFTNAFAEKEQTVVQKIPQDLPLILADADRLIQVMTNFVSNAHKYSPPGATVTIEAKLVEDEQSKAGEQLHIAVSDTGIGMSEEDLNKMFTPYFRSENKAAQDQPGTGLGMTLTRLLVIQHGGDIWVESVLGEGTTFNFTVPVATEKQA